ncbi:MAG: hypothetical protein KAS32_28650 [Candidatus Peribacteraceae bacterium]|nr:hypothetical protein [Candidatus Peribacteraceae bacterium]
MKILVDVETLVMLWDFVEKATIYVKYTPNTDLVWSNDCPLIICREQARFNAIHEWYEMGVWDDLGERKMLKFDPWDKVSAVLIALSKVGERHANKQKTVNI